jgi:PhoH-like ATPase
MIVLEELDGHKKGMTEVARNARQTSRTLDALAGANGDDIGTGLLLDTTGHREAKGKLFFQTQPLNYTLAHQPAPGQGRQPDSGCRGGAAPAACGAGQ